MADRRHHREREHDERHVTVPAMPRAGFVVIEAEFVLGGLEAVLDRPALPFDKDQALDVGPGRAPGGEERQIAIGDVAPDQETTRPQAGSGLIVFGSVEVGEFEIGPVVQSGTLGSFARR